MNEPMSFQQDCIELAKERLGRGEIDRRAFLGIMAALGAGLGTGLAGSGPARAQGKTVTMVNWGGVANDGFGNFYGKPFEAKNPGVKVVQDSSGPSLGKIRAMVEAKKVTWDLCDSSSGSSILLGSGGFVEPIDYKIVKKSDILEKGFAYPHGAAPYSFSTLLIWDSAKFKDDPPKDFTALLDFKRYPGKRMLRRDANAGIEVLMMAAGVAADKVNPLDKAKAFEALKALRKDSVYWTSGSQSEQIMRTGEATIGYIWNTRAKILQEETKGRITFTWNQGILQAGAFVIPKGNPAGELAQHCLASMCANEEGQVGLLGFLGNGPTNPRAAAKVPENLRKFNPTDPDNVKVQVVQDGEWWGKNYATVNQEFLDIIAS